MATLDECQTALVRLSENLAQAERDIRVAASLDRSLSCHITDLGILFVGHLANGTIKDVAVAEGSVEKAQIRLTMTGDDLVALVEGRLHFATAWASGRVKLEAGFRDLLRLRSFL